MMNDRKQVTQVMNIKRGNESKNWILSGIQAANGTAE